MNRLTKGLGALGLLTAMAGAADAGFRKHGGDCAPAPAPCGSYGAAPQMQYVTEYRQVQRTVYKMVADVKDVEVTTIEYDRDVKKGKREVTYYVQKMKPMAREYTVYERELKSRQEKVTYYKPVMKTIDQDFWVCEPVSRIVDRKETYYEPVYGEKVIEQPVTVWRQVPSVENRQVTCYQRVSTPVCDPCGNVRYTCQSVPVTQTVQVTVMRCQPETTLNKYTVRTCDYVQKSRDVKVTLVENQMKKVTRPVQVWSNEAVTENVTVQYWDVKPVVRTENYQICVVEPDKRMEDFEEVSYKPREVKKMVQQTTWRCVADVITETVPFTVCVPVAPCR